MSKKEKLLQGVREVQQYLAIGAEILLLLAFFTSGMDVSLGGTMAGLDLFKWVWAFVFALGIDTSFVLSWVRCRQIGKSWQQCWSLPLALGMSLIVFQPVAIQLLQQALSISFDQALSYLGINIVILVYARALVAVCLGGILALTNVEKKPDQAAIVQPKRTFLPLKTLLDKYAPIDQGSIPAPVLSQSAHQGNGSTVKGETPSLQKRTLPLTIVQSSEQTPEQKIRLLLQEDSTLSVRALARSASCTPSTADKWKKRILSEPKLLTRQTN